MSLQSLINNQTIRIDDHKRGCSETKKWDDSSLDIHIDKSTKYKIDGKLQDVRIRIPINSERPIKIESKKKEIPIPYSLEKEIKNAFNNEKKRDAFIKDLIVVLKNFHSNLDDLERAKQTLKRIAKHFNLNWTNEQMITFSDKALLELSQLYENLEGQSYYVTINKEAIEIGDVDKNNKNTFKWTKSDD